MEETGAAERKRGSPRRAPVALKTPFSIECVRCTSLHHTKGNAYSPVLDDEPVEGRWNRDTKDTGNLESPWCQFVKLVRVLFHVVPFF